MTGVVSFPVVVPSVEGVFDLMKIKDQSFREDQRSIFLTSQLDEVLDWPIRVSRELWRDVDLCPSYIFQSINRLLKRDETYA